jgi:hypothetical protein
MECQFLIVHVIIIIIIIIISGVRLSPFCTAATTGLLYQPRMIGDGHCGDIGGIEIGKGNRSTRRKPAPATNRLSYGAALDLTLVASFTFRIFHNLSYVIIATPRNCIFA